jgi:hypothetical protein
MHLHGTTDVQVEVKDVDILNASRAIADYAWHKLTDCPPNSFSKDQM